MHRLLSRHSASRSVNLSAGSFFRLLIRSHDQNEGLRKSAICGSLQVSHFSGARKQTVKRLPRLASFVVRACAEGTVRRGEVVGRSVGAICMHAPAAAVKWEWTASSTSISFRSKTPSMGRCRQMAWRLACTNTFNPYDALRYARDTHLPLYSQRVN
jgi:hypothetical protein